MNEADATNTVNILLVVIQVITMILVMMIGSYLNKINNRVEKVEEKASKIESTQESQKVEIHNLQKDNASLKTGLDAMSNKVVDIQTTTARIEEQIKNVYAVCEDLAERFKEAVQTIKPTVRKPRGGKS